MRPGRGVSRLLLALALAHAALWAVAAVHPGAMLRFDRAPTRLEAARALAGAGSAAEAVGVLARSGTLGDYAWHALALVLVGGWLPGVALLQLALHALALWALFGLVRDLDGRPAVAWLAVAIYALIPIDFMVPHFLGSEAVFNPLLVLGTAQVVRFARRDPRMRRLVGAGLLYTLAAITRPEVMAWLVVAAVGVAVLAHARAPRDALGRAAVFALCLVLGPLAFMGFNRAATGDFGFGAPHGLGHEIQQRVAAVHGDCTVHEVGREDRSPLDLLRAAAQHPVPFARQWASHTAKLLLLPDNLDAFRYLGLYEYTGQRAALVHSLGWWGAVQAVFREMPVLTSWLLVSSALFALLWLTVLHGARLSFRDGDAVHRLTCALLASLPAVYVALRVLTQGESRKRSPVDFVLATFAAIGIHALWTSRRPKVRPRC